MPTFHYKALNARGETVEGQMEAAHDADVVLRLQDQGHYPLETQLADGIGKIAPSLQTLLRKAPLDASQLVQFTQQLSTLLGAGQPLDRALSILSDLPDGQAGRVIANIRDVVRGGASLSTALEQQHGVFSRLYINMVHAGEAGGSLHDTLRRLADYLERSSALRSKVINALIYPAILLVVVGLALCFLLGYVVPQFGSMYESLDVTLPWFTHAVLSFGNFLASWWIALVVVLGLAIIALERKQRDPRFRAGLDVWLLHRRFIGPLIARIEAARLARTLGTLLRNGVPLLAGLGIASKVLTNLALAEDVAVAAEDVKNGQGLSLALGRSKRFPKLALQMIQVGEESGALDTMLLKAADVFEQEVGLAIDRLLAALVPMITLMMALLIGTVIIAVLVPLYDLTNSIG